MIFPVLVQEFSSDNSGLNTIEILISELQNNTDINAKVVTVSHNSLCLTVRHSHPLEGNPFLPNIQIAILDEKHGSHGTIYYSLQKGSKVIFAICYALAVTFECILLCLITQLSSFLLLLIPIVMIIFGAILSSIGLHIMSKRIQTAIFKRGQGIVCGTIKRSTWGQRDGLREP